jgi:eukaryotic-like serine/threonine-protein kinase
MAEDTFDPESATLAGAPPTERDRESAAVNDLAAQTSVSALSVGEIIGEGGMGVVRVAVQRSLARAVAIKSSLPGANESDAIAMLREAWVTGFLEHPGVVPVYDIVKGERGSPIVVMRRIHGATWEARAKDDTWARDEGVRDLLEQNLRVLVRVCEIVEFAHAKGVIHRDIKPANVMVGQFGEVYLLDWGLAVALRGEAMEHLPTVNDRFDVSGTLAYAAPEMVGLADGALGEHTDVYLLGAVLYEIATGRPPHDAGTVAGVLESIAASPPRVPARVTPRLAEICSKAMQKAPGDRYLTVTELRHAILAYLRSRDSEHLVEEAERTLRRIEEACRSGGERRSIYDLYGECRFAFREAQRMWPENAEASRGLTRAATLVIELELERDPRVAAALLDDVPTVAPELREHVRAVAQREERERHGLSQLARDHDPRIGRGFRVAFLVVLATGWTASQLFADKVGPITHVRFGIGSLVQLPFLLLGWLLVRDLTRTLFNRRILGAIALTLTGQSLLFFTGYALGVELEPIRVMQVGLWATASGFLTILLERKFWPMTLGFVVALAVSIASPESRAVVSAIAMLAMTANLAAIWVRRDSNRAE